MAKLKKRVAKKKPFLPSVPETPVEVCIDKIAELEEKVNKIYKYINLQVDIRRIGGDTLMNKIGE